MGLSDLSWAAFNPQVFVIPASRSTSQTARTLSTTALATLESEFDSAIELLAAVGMEGSHLFGWTRDRNLLRDKRIAFHLTTRLDPRLRQLGRVPQNEPIYLDMKASRGPTGAMTMNLYIFLDRLLDAEGNPRPHARAILLNYLSLKCFGIIQLLLEMNIKKPTAQLPSEEAIARRADRVEREFIERLLAHAVETTLSAPERHHLTEILALNALAERIRRTNAGHPSLLTQPGYLGPQGLIPFRYPTEHVWSPHLPLSAELRESFSGQMAQALEWLRMFPRGNNSLFCEAPPRHPWQILVVMGDREDRLFEFFNLEREGEVIPVNHLLGRNLTVDVVGATTHLAFVHINVKRLLNPDGTQFLENSRVRLLMSLWYAYFVKLQAFTDRRTEAPIGVIQARFVQQLHDQIAFIDALLGSPVLSTLSPVEVRYLRDSRDATHDSIAAVSLLSAPACARLIAEAEGREQWAVQIEPLLN